MPQSRRRFGTLPAAAQERAARATEAELEARTDRVLTATSLDVVFDDTPE